MLNLKFTGEIREVSECLKHLGPILDFRLAEDGIPVSVSKRVKNGLSVNEKEGEYSIGYGIIPDFCRALCILVDHLKKQEKDCFAEEERGIDLCGIMLDVSRNAVIKVESAKDMIRRIACMGMNTFMLYMENIYKLEKYPYFGYMRGAYSQQELREIDEYAQIFGVEVVPCIQTLGHLSNALRWPYAKNMKDTEDILLIDEPETYVFIEEMIRTLSECLSSDRVHIGMDEAFAVGTGRYKALHGSVDQFEMLTRHIAKVKEILDKYGKKPIMWCDMVCRYGSPIGRYWDPETNVPEHIAQRFPKEITMAHWDYYHEEPDNYRRMLTSVKKISGKVAFYGGVWIWGGLTVNYDKTFRTTKPALQACREIGVNEVCATLWGDDGGEVSFYSALLGMQLYAEYIYHDKVDDAHLKEMFRICTGYEMDSFMRLDADNFPEADRYKENFDPIYSAITVSKQMFYQDILQGLLDKQYEHVNLKGHYENVLNQLSCAEVPRDLTELFEYHLQLVKVLYLKCDMGIRIKANYKDGNMNALRKNADELKLLETEVNILHSKMSKLWLKNNKAFGLDRLDLRYGGVLMRVKRAAQRIESYLNGEIAAIEELEEDRLMFSNDEFVHTPFYNYYVSASMQIEKRW